MEEHSLSSLIKDFSLVSVDSDEVDINSTVECFPRCEYCFRYQDTSTFNMSDPNFWGTYFRSTGFGGNADRLAQLSKKKKYFRNDFLNYVNVPIAKAGSLVSPWENDSYNDVLSKIVQTFVFYLPQEKRRLCSIRYKTLSLYDLLLDYKNNMAKNISLSFNRQDNSEIDVYHCNDYPCVMVTIPRLQKTDNKSKSPVKSKDDVRIIGETSSIYSIICAYFVPICNRLAQAAGIPIEMVLRSSFGHSGPSVTETSSSFRINVGIIPFEYCNIVASSLFLLQESFIKPLFESKLKLLMTPEEIYRHNIQVRNYNRLRNSRGEKFNVEDWHPDEPLLHVLCKVGDSRRSKVSYQLARMNKYLDLLAHFVSDEIQFNGLEVPSLSNFAQPLSKLLNCLIYKIEESLKVEAIAQMQVLDHLYKRELLSFNQFSNTNLETDEEFWKILSIICDSLNVSDYLSQAINERKLSGLYSKLERANVEFIGKSHLVKEPYESDSDCDVEVEPYGETSNLKLYCRRLTVATGIRAINLAQFISLYALRTFNKKPEVDVTYMYYETSKVINFINSVDKFFPQKDLTESACIKYIDLNHCAACGTHEVYLDKISVEPYDIIILDYTSARSKKINHAIKMFINRVSIIILISSGVKHEQVGADINPYGTVRIITKNLSLLNELYLFAKASINSEVLPVNLHRIRKAYEAIGAVVTFKEIFRDDTLQYMHRKQDDTSVFRTTDSINWFFNLVNNDNLREKVCIPLFDSRLEGIFLTCAGKESLNELVEMVPDLCLLAETYSLSTEINCLEIEKLGELVQLYNTKPDRIDRLLGKYNQKLSFLMWSNEKFSFLSSSMFEHFWDELFSEDKIDFNDVETYYDSDSDLVESVVSFYQSLSDQGSSSNAIFFHDDFNSLCEKLADKQRESIHGYCYDPDFSYESELSSIYTQNLHDDFSEGWGSQSSD